MCLKHDQLLNKLLTRFNDFQTNMEEMVTKMVEKKFSDMDLSSNLNSIELLKNKILFWRKRYQILKKLKIPLQMSL